MSLITRGLGANTLITRGLGGFIEPLLFSGLRVHLYDDQSRVALKDKPERLSVATRAERLLKGSSPRNIIIDKPDRLL
jgi:hypothetical protein